MPDKAAPLVDAHCADNPGGCADGRIDIDYEHIRIHRGARQDNIVDILEPGLGDYFNVDREVKLQNDLITDVAQGSHQVVAWRQFGAPDPAADRVWPACDSIDFVSPKWPRYCDQSREALLNTAQNTTDLAGGVPLLCTDNGAMFSHRMWIAGG